MTTTSKLFTGHEDPQHDVGEEREAAEKEPDHEQHAPDPALYPGEARETAADAGDPFVGGGEPQAIDGEAGARAGNAGEQARLRLLELGLAQRALGEQLVQLLELVGRRHQISSTRRAGSSRASLMDTRNKTASLPSMMRWS